LIVGAGGTIGSYAVQVARALGAEVTAVDSAGKLDMLRSLGAEHVIDYAKEDFTRSGQTYDAIIDLVGKNSFSRILRSLKPNGRYVVGYTSLSAIIRGWWTSKTTGKKVVLEQAHYRAEEYTFLMRLIEEGKVRPAIDRQFPLEQTAEAHRYAESGQKKGNVVVTVG
jgi:NADPH:quinone reductase-like Zn-dependent oxidoreductase